MLAATINFEFERQAIAFVEGRKTRALHCGDMNECVRLSVIALDEAEALHRVEELDRSLRLLTGQLALRSLLLPLDRDRLALDLDVGGGYAAAAIDQGESERLTFREIAEAGLLDCRNVDEHVFAPVITNDEAEALLRVEEFDDSLRLSDYLRGHSATATAAAAESTSATAAAVTATESAAIAKAARLTVASALLESTAILETVFAEKAVALVSAATAAVAFTPSVETHAVQTFLVPQNHQNQRAGEHGATGLGCAFLTHHLQPYMKKKPCSSDSIISTLLWAIPYCSEHGEHLAWPVMRSRMSIHFHEEDLGEDVRFADGPIAVDTEAMGLVPGRDRLCLVQLSDGKGDEHLVRFGPDSDYSAPRLKALLSDPSRLKLYHFARFDVGIMSKYLGIVAAPLYCTRTASRLVRTYTDRHGLKDLVKELLGHDLSKQQQTSDWGAPQISDAQRDYAASDVRYLHALKEKLDERLARENRTELAQACFDFLPYRALLDIAGWPDQDIFAHDG